MIFKYYKCFKYVFSFLKVMEMRESWRMQARLKSLAWVSYCNIKNAAQIGVRDRHLGYFREISPYF